MQANPERLRNDEPDEPVYGTAEDVEAMEDEERARAEREADDDETDEPAEPVRIRDAERTRARVLDAAERVFARQGFEAARLQEIGRAAGVSRGTPGYFFRSKEQLYRTVMERLFAESREALGRVEGEVRVGGGEPWHLLAKYIDGYLDFLARRPAFVRLVQWECVSGGPFLAQIAAHFEAMRDALHRVLAAGGARFRPIDPTHLMLTVVGASWLPLTVGDTVLPLMRVDADDPTFIANRKRHMSELVLYGIHKAVGAPTSLAAGGHLPAAPSPRDAGRGPSQQGPHDTMADQAARRTTWRLPGE